LSGALSSFLRPLKNKGFEDQMMAKIGLEDIATSTTPESNKSHPDNWVKWWLALVASF
jgi:hypothetical protein